MAKSDFVNWLQSEMDNRGWRQSDLARHGELHTGHLSKVLSGERFPGIDFCKGIARAFGMRDIEVMRLAGLADPEPATDTPSLRELTSKFAQLSDDDQETILKMVRALEESAQAQKRRGLKPRPKAG
jgi:transcriptional regulator with XRE-family HTH domain